jgi:hypothetical protein
MQQAKTINFKQGPQGPINTTIMETLQVSPFTVTEILIAVAIGIAMVTLIIRAARASS